jgi:hypothetical protein
LTGEPAKPLKPDTELNGDIPLYEKHHPILLHLLAQELNVDSKDIVKESLAVLLPKVTVH